MSLVGCSSGDNITPPEDAMVDDGPPIDEPDANVSVCIATGDACATDDECCTGHCLDLNGTNIADQPVCVTDALASVYADFQTSLHRSPRGMRTFYEGTPEDPGMGTLSGKPYDELACNSCHRAGSTPGTAKLADNTDVPVAQYEQSCIDCHADPLNPGPVPDQLCLGCHSRQNAEINLAASTNPAVAERFSDVHRTASTPMGCSDCHSAAQLHGDGVQRSSMLEWRTTQCENCHVAGGQYGPLNMAIVEHARHAGATGELACESCHVQTVTACYSCHFETEIGLDQKKYFGPPPLNGFVFLANDMRPGGGKVTTASFQSLTHGTNAFAGFAPFYAHTISREGRVCADCHATATTQEYQATGQLRITTWTPPASAGQAGSIAMRQGVIPIPRDWRTSFQWDFVGAPMLGPTLPDFTLFVDPNGADFQMLSSYLTPLTNQQMNRISNPH
ncbi:MAG: hypothetical protein AB7T06_30215 [Kofleriaceae bacterium]